MPDSLPGRLLGVCGLGFAPAAGCLCRSLEPGCCLQPLEGLACFSEWWLCLSRPALCGEPFGVVELGDGEVEGEADLAEEAGGGVEPLLDVFVVAAGSVEAGRFADLVAVPGDVLADIHATEHPLFVMKRGAVIVAPAGVQ